MKKALILNFSPLNTAELIKELRLKHLDCVGFDEKTQFLAGDLRNKDYVKKFCATVLISEYELSEVDKAYAAALCDIIPLIHICYKEDNLIDKITSYIYEYCASYTVEKHLLETQDYMKKSSDPSNIICNVSGDLSAAISTVICNKVYASGNVTYIFVDNIEYSKNCFKDMQKLWGEFYDIPIIAADPTGVTAPLPKFESNSQMKRHFKQNDRLVSNFFEKITGSKDKITGFVVGNDCYFDGMHKKKIITTYSSIDCPNYHFPLIRPCKNFFYEEINEIAQLLNIPTELQKFYLSEVF